MVVLSLMTGSYPLTPGQVISALVHEIVVEWRLPRVTAALIFGPGRPGEFHEQIF